MTTAARLALDQGLIVLVGQLPTSFTVQGFESWSFTGLCEDVTHRNQLGIGGLLPDADAVLTVNLAEFARASLVPRVGMRLQVHGRQMIVGAVSRNEHKWT